MKMIEDIAGKCTNSLWTDYDCDQEVKIIGEYGPYETDSRPMRM